MKNGDSELLTTSYAFKTVNSKATGQVGTMRNLATGYDVSYTYEYDGNGNILSVSDGTYTTSYQYDQSNQLVRENNQKGGYTYTWVYDRAGNILSRTEYAYTTGTLGTPTETVTYTYGNSAWGDQLTAMGDRAFTYDQIGNVLSDGNRTYTWEHGRQLATLTQNGATWTNTYDVNGLRMKRTDGTNTYQYYYVGGDLISMTYNGSKLYFSYTPDGLPYGVEYGGNQYVYVLNLQGDIMAILNESGEAVVEYTYNAWGNILSITGSMADTLGQINPLRYRSYVYDRETGLYYLQSRYYDPAIGRFINADKQLSSPGGKIVGCNPFVYCFNNPTNMNDRLGEWAGYVCLCWGVQLLKNIVKGQLVKAVVKNAVSSFREPNYEAVDKLLDESVQTGVVSNDDGEIRSNNVQLPEDSKGLLYNKQNRIYASKKIKNKLRADTKRTTEDISSEIFAHQFAADICSPLSIFSGVVPSDYDIYGRLSKADIDEGEGRIGIFDFMEGVLEWE